MGIGILLQIHGHTSRNYLKFSALSHNLQVPSQVTDVTLSKEVTHGRPTLRVTWTTPQSNVTISEYHVQFRRSGTEFWGSQVTITGSPPYSANLTGLDAGTEYNVRVRAVSAAGEGEWSEVQTERTFNGEHRVSMYIDAVEAHSCVVTSSEIH